MSVTSLLGLDCTGKECKDFSSCGLALGSSELSEETQEEFNGQEYTTHIFRRLTMASDIP